MGAIYLIRHGQAAYGEADYDRLSGVGLEQGAVVGAELLRRQVRFTEGRTGSLTRQRRTAETVLDRIGSSTTAKEDPRWNEYDHVDIVSHHGDGISQSDVDSRGYQGVLDGALAEWIGAGEDSPCAESWPAFLARVRGALDDLVAVLGKGENAVVFTSGGVIGALAGVLLGDPVMGLLKMNRVAVNCGITKLVSGRSGVTLLSFNEHSHFDGRAAQLLTYR
ncbi:histidine phosphatase family protein [Amycolatopsis sp. K13G38]|uniref:Histidine phosphatase family protein n=1 Tax=Amycolatopsis acididurans TaxID=2724524 RepID=A0ABX1J7A3_9PSEU|nr:histidine phosphatase family protein [Amycolatopsis acididurans]NKQ54172.1 histidine phosphatase family protein [Amycolatopsis acididurans]